jgi:hypothetical protein
LSTAAPGGPLVGYRCWVAERGRLRCATSDELWPGGIFEARCGDDAPHAAPEITCQCGIFGCDSHQTALRYRDHRRRWRPWLRAQPVVVGAVQLWGGPGRPVIVGELRPDRRGRTGLQYRAPYARIVALARSPHAERAGRALGVPVVESQYLEAFAREMGGVQLRPPAAGEDAPAVRGPNERSPVAPAGARPGPLAVVRSVRSVRSARPVDALLAAGSAREAAAVLGRELPPLLWLALCALARAAVLLLWTAARVTWWITWRAAWLAALALVAVLGHLLEETSPRRKR